MGLTKGMSKKTKIVVYLLLGALIGVGAYYLMNYFLSPYLTTPTEDNLSTFKLTSYPDGEDVSDFLEISIWVPKSTATFDEIEDIYTLTNFEKEKSSVDADDASLDLSGFTHVWVEIDPDGEQVFANDFHYLVGGINYDYTIDVYHQSSDVNFNILDSTLGDLNLTLADDVVLADNYTLILDIPHYTTTNCHYGTNWDIEQTEFDDMTASQKEVVWDEKNWRCQAPTYDPSVDIEKDYDKELEKLTNAFAIKLDFNATISTVDGNDNQINMTVESGAPCEVIFSGDLIYLVFYEVLNFESGSLDIKFEATTGSTIGLDNAESGRIVVPRDDDALGTFTKYSDISA